MSSGIYVCSMDTKHYSFIAVGDSEEGAKFAMVQTMRRHRSQAGPNTWHPIHYKDSESWFYPENDLGWLMWLIEDQYSANVTGPYSAGASGTCDGSFIALGEK